MSQSIKQTMGTLEWGLIIALSLLWGSGFFMTELALDGLPPVTLAFSRVSLAALALYIIAKIMGYSLPRDRKIWIELTIMSLFNNVAAYTLTFWGQTQITGSLASVFNATSPLFAILIAHVFLRDERLSTGKIIGVILGLAGVVVIVGFDALKGLGLHVLAELAVVGTALAYAIAVVYGRRFHAQPPIVTATGQLIVSSIIMLPIAAYFDQFWLLDMPSTTAWIAILWIALLSTAAAYLIFFRVLATSGATNVILVTFLIPPSAILLGFVFLDERLELQQVLGMALIALGLLAIDGRTLGWFKQRL